MDIILKWFADSFPQLVVLLLIVVSAAFVLREWRLMRTELRQEVQKGIQAEIGSLTGEIVKKNEEARNQLNVLASVQSDVQKERQKFEEEITGAKNEIERVLNEVRSRSSEMEKLAPTRRDLEWIPPRVLVLNARQARNWPEASGYLLKMDHGNATSGDLEVAGDVCRDFRFFAKAIEFYREAAEKDPENVSARGELLALTAESRAPERDEALKQLQNLVLQSSNNLEYGGNIQKRYFNALMELGRYQEMASFCETQLRQPLPREIEATLHRNLAVSYQKLGRVDEALTQCQAALKLSSDDVNVLRLYGRLLLGQERYDDAYAIATRGLRSEPTEASIYVLVARIEQKRSGARAARPFLERARAFADASERIQIEEQIAKLDILEELEDLLSSPTAHADAAKVGVT